MLAVLNHWFVMLIYQPLFNLVVFFYWGVDQVSNGENTIGVAVILLAVVIRILLLPQSLNSIQNERKQIAVLKDIAKLEAEFSADPVELNRRKKELIRSKPSMIFGEIVGLVIQVMIALMLWRMFGTGLTGQDLHLIYPFMPEVEQPFNLIFMGIPLDQPSFATNFTLMVLLFIMETLSVLASIPGSISRSRAIKAQLLLPIISFIFFSFMPAGKQLFVIVSVIFSIILTFIRLILVRFDLYKQKQEEKVAVVEEQVLVETK